MIDQSLIAVMPNKHLRLVYTTNFRGGKLKVLKEALSTDPKKKFRLVKNLSKGGVKDVVIFATDQDDPSWTNEESREVTDKRHIRWRYGDQFT
ncbi:hypothetical protein DY000_02016221 [Brassica cretica]|uniref:Uncharacterized protein n=1 Tax=Brassica cretica TaxID=69181 RepID=A0ABQ7CMI1_BRACR|nr:hypothetical protein DY000_02016221 [Brassica cretica]